MTHFNEDHKDISRSNIVTTHTTNTMSPRKRPRAMPSDAPPADDNPSSSTNTTAVPTPIPSQENSTASTNSSTNTNTNNDGVSKSPANSVAPSIDSRYASLKESKTKTRSWYGSWPRAPKSSASTQVARESILGGTSKPSAAADFSRYEPRKPDEAESDTLGVGGLTLSRKSSTLTLGGKAGNNGSSLKNVTQNSTAVSTPVITPTIAVEAATPSKDKNSKDSKDLTGKPSIPDVKLGPPVGLPPLPGTQPKPKSKAELIASAAAAAADKAIAAVSTASPAKSKAATSSTTSTTMPPPPVPKTTETTSETPAPAATSTPAQEAVPSQGWLSWARREAAPPKSVAAEDTARSPPPEPETAKVEEPEDTTKAPAAPEQQPESTAPERPTTSSGMWSYFWGAVEQPVTETTETADSKDTKDVVMEDAPSAPIPVPAASNASINTASVANSPAPPATATASAGSTWAFWSRDSRKTTTGKSPSASEPGEIAVIGDQSEAHPTPAAGIKMSDQPSSKASSIKASSIKDVAMKDAAATTAAAKKSKRLRPKSMEIDDIAPGPGTPPPEAQAQGQTGASAATAKPADKTTTNILLPSFRSTYRMKENPSILRQITRYLLPMQGSAKPTHLFLAKEPPRVKKAVAIGVHGLFPAAYLRPMIGQPTGTSIRFANHAAEATRRWADSHGFEDCEIEKIALEGEGKIADRVDNLWKLMLNWIDHIRGADLVVFACHSQGVPVSFMLLSKLIDLGIVTTARIGVCAMAGVSLGPFPDYKSGLGILMGSAGELWEFGNPESEVSKRYALALRTALDYGVRVTFVGSIDDQVVPLESAIFSPVHHPYVYRAVFVDGRIHAPDFIAHLIGFACKLRNLGVSDHGLVRELSVPLAGSLYSGEGHSRLYDDAAVYDLALSHTLETADLESAASGCEIKKHDGLTSPNPYVLPWIMRGLLEEDFVKTELQAETAELVRQFDEWKPVTKALKDVKYRLEAVRSKL